MENEAKGGIRVCDLCQKMRWEREKKCRKLFAITVMSLIDTITLTVVAW